MPHLRLYTPQEWLRDDFKAATGFDAAKLLDILVRTLASLRMEESGTEVPLITLSNLKHAIIPMQAAHAGGDASTSFLHITLEMGNDTPGRTAEVRNATARALGEEADKFTAGLPNLASVTVHVKDIDRARGYSTAAERRKKVTA